MKTHNAENERIKRRYLRYLKEAKRQSEASLDAVAKALSRFEASTKHQDFRAFRIEQAVAFKQRLAAQVSERTGETLSKATLYSTLNALRNFFQWLAGQPRFKSRLTYSDADYFNPSEAEVRIATAHRDRPTPTLEQIDHVLRSMPCGSAIERRDRALVAFIILTGVRDRAVASLKLKHIDLAEGVVHQDAREVRTKASKTITTWFFPVGDLARQIATGWVEYLRDAMLWGHDDPLFPATRVAQDGDRQFAVVGFERKHWASAGPIRKVFATAFNEAGLPYFNPHSFRKTLTLLGEKRCRTPEEFKAWSQNLGHKKVMTTFSSYGAVSGSRQAEILRDLGMPRAQTQPEEALQQINEIVSRLRRAG